MNVFFSSRFAFAFNLMGKEIARKRFFSELVFIMLVSLTMLQCLGCQNFVSMDGIWKLRFPHCMYPVTAEVDGFKSLNYPNVCTNSPASQGSAFCSEHCITAENNGVPTGLRNFLSDYCGLQIKTTGTYGFCK